MDSSLVPIRRSRALLLLILAGTCVFFYLKGPPSSAFWSLPEHLKTETRVSKASVSGDKPQEIHGLLHMVTSTTKELTNVAGGEALDFSAYDASWTPDVKALNEQYPLVVFSKVRIWLITFYAVFIEYLYNPDLLPVSKVTSTLFNHLMLRRYSKRGKALLESYKLDPPPKVIEVDLRG
jgi:hypothetical protein